MADRVGQQLGNYQLVRLLGSGAFAKVYLGQHVQLKTQAVIKVSATNISHDQEAIERFRTEARILSSLHHPYIVRFLEFGTEGDTPFLVVDYAPNGSLRQRHPRGSRVPLTTVVSYVKQVAAALQYTHDQKLIHRDVKPDNLLLGPNNEVLLDDFAIAIDISHESEQDSSAGTPYYMAPEQWQSEPEKASDQYALAVVVYEWLTGSLPFSEGSFIQLAYQHAYEPVPPLRDKNPAISPEVEAVIMKALAKDPKQRFESVQAFADALEKASLPPKIIQKAADRVGQQFGNYRLIRSLGRGGFADVYLGQHRRLNTYAAIKVLHTRLSNEDLEGFQKEAQTIANLRHPSIVRVLDFDVEGGIPFLVMDHAPNGTLRQRHPKASRLPLTTIVSYVKQVAAALQYAHDQKLIHRDVKPENMLLGPNNEVWLSDFGIAAVAHSPASQRTEDVIGTALYMAPEQWQGKPLLATDQYALGVIVYEWLSGECPFGGGHLQLMYKHIQDSPPPLRGKAPTLSPEVEQVVMIALAKDPQRRFKSVQAFATALEQASRQGR